MINNKVFEIRQWILRGEHDLGTAKITYTHLPKYYDTISFHCQQAVEKYIKALLIYFEVDFPRTHNLVYLISLLNEHLNLSEALIENAILLNNYSVQIRYPNDIIELTKEELENAISTAESYKNLTEQFLISNNLMQHLD